MRQPVPVPATPTSFSRIYPGSADYVHVVRADLRMLLDGGCPIADDAIPAASELAANAALHSRSAEPGGHFTLRAEIQHHDYLWIEVEDNGGSWTTSTAEPGRSHGLDIIDALASDWGIDGDYLSHVVWLRLDWPAGGGQ